MNTQLHIGDEKFHCLVNFHDFHPSVAFNDYLESVSQRKKRWSILSSAKKPAMCSKLQELVLFYVLFFVGMWATNYLFRWTDVDFKWWKVWFTKCHAIWKCKDVKEHTRFCLSYIFFQSLSSSSFLMDIKLWTPLPLSHLCVDESFNKIFFFSLSGLNGFLSWWKHSDWGQF